jgi:hypothetical protein
MYRLADWIGREGGQTRIASTLLSVSPARGRLAPGFAATVR